MAGRRPPPQYGDQQRHDPALQLLQVLALLVLPTK